jgi:hypothetical protein
MVSRAMAGRETNKESIVSTLTTLTPKPQAELKAQVKALNFYYGDFQALKNIDFRSKRTRSPR